MITTLHPSMILCTPEKWADEVFQDKFIDNLLLHLNRIKELKLSIAWCDEILCSLWKESPWKDNYYYEEKLNEIYYEITNCNCMLSPPPDNECSVVPNIKVDTSKEIDTCWLILLHRVMHKKDEIFITVGLDVNNEINSICVSCNCKYENCKNTYKVISDPSEWYKIIDYMTLYPKDVENWDEEFLLTLKVCYEQEFSQRKLKIKIESLNFAHSFKKTLKNISDEGTKRRIIKTISQRLTYTDADAGFHSGLRDEIIEGKNGERSIRISRGERIHYRKEGNNILFLNYYPSSEHDERCK